MSIETALFDELREKILSVVSLGTPVIPPYPPGFPEPDHYIMIDVGTGVEECGLYAAEITVFAARRINGDHRLDRTGSAIADELDAVLTALSGAVNETSCVHLDALLPGAGEKLTNGDFLVYKKSLTARYTLNN